MSVMICTVSPPWLGEGGGRSSFRGSYRGLVGECDDADHECNDKRNAENRYSLHGHVLCMKSHSQRSSVVPHSASGRFLAGQRRTLPMHGGAPGLDRLVQDHLVLLDELLSLVHRLVHEIGGLFGQLLDLFFGSPRIPTHLLP